MSLYLYIFMSLYFHIFTPSTFTFLCLYVFVRLFAARRLLQAVTIAK